ncbi:MAG TPA: NTP transferase domain-containing protein [Croceibacterium sp.]|nr:NTP transferase domain-containing protein [Croceibacterium sp.]
MNCLILAAGLGSRLRGISDSKPLTPVGGVPLIEHVIRRAAKGGATRIVVVTGHAAERVEAYLAELQSRLALPLGWERVDDWTRPNGYSVLAGAAVLNGNYLLSMCDHVFDPAILHGLRAEAPAGVTLAVDRKLGGPLLDLDDATKVQVAPDGGIAAIGKTLAVYNAIDTGLFLATPALAEAIRADIAAGGSGSLSEGVQRLADAGRARTMDVGSAAWIDVDSPAMLALAERLVASDSLTGSAA